FTFWQISRQYDTIFNLSFSESARLKTLRLKEDPHAPSESWHSPSHSLSQHTLAENLPMPSIPLALASVRAPGWKFLS
ncbi:MAG: hypothetical protein WAU17_10410, partial [Nitrospirales bacterium]